MLPSLLFSFYRLRHSAASDMLVAVNAELPRCFHWDFARIEGPQLTKDDAVVPTRVELLDQQMECRRLQRHAEALARFPETRPDQRIDAGTDGGLYQSWIRLSHRGEVGNMKQLLSSPIRAPCAPVCRARCRNALATAAFPSADANRRGENVRTSQSRSYKRMNAGATVPRSASSSFSTRINSYAHSTSAFGSISPPNIDLNFAEVGLNQAGFPNVGKPVVRVSPFAAMVISTVCSPKSLSL